MVGLRTIADPPHNARCHSSKRLSLFDARIDRGVSFMKHIGNKRKPCVLGAGLASVLVMWAPGSIAQTEAGLANQTQRSEEHTSELQSLMRISYAVFCLKKKKKYNTK